MKKAEAKTRGERMKPYCVPLDRSVFYGCYANIPHCLRDKSCGLSWNEVYNLLENKKPKPEAKE